MKDLIKTFDGFSKIVKVILALPCLDIIWVIYRICRSLDKNNMVGVILGVVLVIIGIPFLWLVDIITILLNDKVLWID